MEFITVLQTANYNPGPMVLVGMITVFSGLIVLNLFINFLKFISHAGITREQNAVEESDDSYNEALLKNIELDDDEVLAVSLGLAIEYDLYYSERENKLTFSYPDKNPMLLNKRR
ncbi:MAG: OadG family protein [bacterium]